jgi:hypothetical protein
MGVKYTGRRILKGIRVFVIRPGWNALYTQLIGLPVPRI